MVLLNAIDYVGIFLVLVIFLWRFNLAPVMQSPAAEGAGPGAKILKWFWASKGVASDLFLPPRANTTLFKYRLYQLIYAMLGLLIYLAILKIPALGHELQDIVKLIIPPEQLAIPDNVGPVVLAFLIAVVLPMIPPFSLWDAAIRFMLYERAAIPAQQLRERNRLKKSPYLAKAEDLDSVRKNLLAEGFAPADIHYDAENPSTCSLWTKAALLMESMSQWEARNKYQTAFAILKERDGVKLSAVALKEKYEALQGDAEACFEAMREASAEPETVAREDQFRQNCKGLLDQIYDLFSRISLHAHYSERERVREMNQLGFGLRLEWSDPIPGHNDLLWLGLILGLLFVLPLSIYTGLGRAIVIGASLFVTVLTPLVLMSKFPQLAAKSDNGVPAIGFPLLSVVIAIVLGMLISVGYQSLIEWNLQAGWERYQSQGYPWAFLLGMVAVLIAWRMQVRTYPEASQLKGIARYRLWGSLGDATIFGLAAAVLMIVVVLPLLNLELGAAGYFRHLLMPVVVSMALGFIVPTWYRAETRRKVQDRRQSGAAARAKFQDKMHASYGLSRRQSPAG